MRFNTVLVALVCVLMSFLAADLARAGTPVVVTPDSQRMMTEAKKQAQVAADAMLAHDYAKITDLTYAPVLKVMGGKAKAIEAMKVLMENPKTGVQFKESKVDDAIELVDTGTTAYVVLPETIQIDVHGNHEQGKGSLLAISDDRGKSWTFVDGSLGEKVIRKVLPDLPEAVKIPDRSPLVLLPPDAAPTTRPTQSTNSPEVAAAETTVEKWVGAFNGKTEAETTEILGKDCVRTDWKGGKYGGPKLVYKFGEKGELSLLFSDGNVIFANLLIGSR